MSAQAQRRQRILAASERLHASRLGLHQPPPAGPHKPDSGPGAPHFGGLLAHALGPLAEAFTAALGANAGLSLEAACDLALGLMKQSLIPTVKRHPWLSLTSSLLTGAWLARWLLRGGKGGPGWRALVEPVLSDALARAATQALAEGLAALLADHKPTAAPETPSPSPDATSEPAPAN